jgi:hypothetical protein
VSVPVGAKQAGTGATRIALWAISAAKFTQATSTLNISNMVVTVTVSPIAQCMQTQSVHVAYLPRRHVHIALTFSKGHTLTLNVVTDKTGTATSRVRVNYVKASSPVRIAVQVSDSSPGAHRMESGAFSVALPKACRKAAT